MSDFGSLEGRYAISALTNTNNNIYLPPELLEMIFAKLETTHLYVCRLVSRFWNEVAVNLLQVQVNNFFTNWNIQKDYKHQGLCIPSVRVAAKAPTFKHYWKMTMKGFNALACTRIPYLGMYRPLIIGTHQSINPFPTKCVRLVIERQSRSTPEINLDSFFSQFGRYLKHLILVDYRTTPDEFIKFLSHFPNLQSLTLEGVSLWYDGDWTMLDLPSLPYLTHLRISSTRANLGHGSIMTEQAIFWILARYSAQLCGLAILGFTFFCSFETLQSVTLQFVNLEQLKINFRNYAVLKVTASARLSHIHIMSDIDADIVDYFFLTLDVTFLQIMKYMQPYSLSLRCLRMSNRICNVKSTCPSFCFPELETLAIRAPENTVEKMVMRTLVLPAFPAVKRLQFIHYDRCYMLKFAIIGEDYWRQCPKLQSITLFDDENYNLTENSHSTCRIKRIWSKSETAKVDVKRV